MESNVFITNRGEISGRIDPNFLKLSKRLNLYKEKSPYPLVPLESFIKIIQYGTSSLASKEKIGVPIIRMNNLKANGWDFTDIKYIALSDIELNRYRVEKGDILFNRTNSKELVGKSDVFEEDGDWVFASYLIRVRLTGKVIPKYISTILNSDLGRLQIDCLSRQIAGMTNINAEEIKSILIPDIPISLQEKIIDFIEEANTEYKRKHLQAINLLNSINSFVLEKLGIKVASTAGKKTFKIHMKDLENRIDPLYYSQDLLHHLKDSKSSVLAIGDLCENFKSGFAAGKQDQTEDGYIQLRPTNVNNFGELYFDKVVYVKKENESKRRADVLKKGEVLFNNTNSQELVGKTAYFDLDGIYFCSNHITRVTADKKKILPEFLCIMLNIYQKMKVFYNTCTNWNNQSGVNIELLKTIKMPVPGLEIQQNIVDEVSNRIKLANQLKTEALENLEQAKSRVEQMILQ